MPVMASVDIPIFAVDGSESKALVDGCAYKRRLLVRNQQLGATGMVRLSYEGADVTVGIEDLLHAIRTCSYSGCVQNFADD